MKNDIIMSDLTYVDEQIQILKLNIYFQKWNCVFTQLDFWLFKLIPGLNSVYVSK